MFGGVFKIPDRISIGAGMKAVNYISTQKLGCSCPPANVILCVDSDLVVSGAPFIEAQLIDINCGSSTCGQVLYTYSFTYDEANLVDPNVGLEACDITGVFCDECMAAYMRWRTSPFAAPEGDEYVYVLPAGPPPFGAGEPFAMDIVSVIGHTVTLGWHSVAVNP